MTNDFKNKQSSGARPPRLSPEEYAAKKKAEKEAIYQLLDNTALEVVQSPEKFKAYLDVQSRMDRYTANNALLMYKQFPQASQIKEFDDWAAEGVKVNAAPFHIQARGFVLNEIQTEVAEHLLGLCTWLPVLYHGVYYWHYYLCI